MLVNIEKNDVKAFNMHRYQQFENLPDDLKEILKRNAVSIRDQLELLPIIREMLLDPNRKNDIVWCSLRDKKLYHHLYAIFDLVKNRFIEGNDKNVLLSVGWMASQKTSYLYNKDINQLVKDRLSYLAKAYLKKEDHNYEEKTFVLDQFVVRFPYEARKL